MLQTDLTITIIIKKKQRKKKRDPKRIKIFFLPRGKDIHFYKICDLIIMIIIRQIVIMQCTYYYAGLREKKKHLKVAKAKKKDSQKNFYK